jgi:hypothetical protein
MTEDENQVVIGQMGPCGIACAACVLGNGSVAETAKKTKEYIQGYGVEEWAPEVPGGSEIDFEQFYAYLDWTATHTRCRGCEKGGGPPDCTIRNCANDKGYQLCSECAELEGCGKFDWLKDHGKVLKTTLGESRGRSKQELIEEALAKGDR